MEKRPFGKTGLSVSILGFGGAGIKGALHSDAHDQNNGSTDDEEIITRLLNGFLDSGVNLIDTAGMYGESEKRIGRAISGRRNEFILSSKCGFDGEMNSDWSEQGITRDIDRSLTDLKTDHIDIMHLHSCDLDTLKKGAVISALLQAKHAGKIRVAAYSGDGAALVWAIRSGHFASIQTSLNICDQRVIDEGLPVASENGLGVIIKRPIANAFWRHETLPKGKYSEEYWKRAKSMQLQPDPLSWAEYAIRFAAFQKGVCSCIIGTTRLEHLHANMAAVAGGPLPAAVERELRERFAAHDDGWVGQT